MLDFPEPNALQLLLLLETIADGSDYKVPVQQ